MFKKVASCAFLAITASLAIFSQNVCAVQIPLSPYATNRLIVKVKDGNAFPSALKSEDEVLRVQHLFASVYVVYTRDIVKTEKNLVKSDEFAYIEKDYYRPVNKLETPTNIEKGETLNQKEVKGEFFNDPGILRQWTFLDDTRFGISVSKAYSNSRTQPRQKITVAVVDTGVDYNHEDLKDIMWTNPGEIAGNGIDDDNNGYIDDIHGINTLVRDASGRATVNMMDGHSHGSHVSGIIGAAQNNGKGIAGIASNIQIMGIRTVPNESDELDVDVVEAFIYAAKNGAKVINCSFGKANNEGGNAVKEAINFIGEKYGVLVVAAAGNDTADIDRTLTYPASYDSANLMVVASTSKRGGLSFFSNYGVKNVDLAAPGSEIYSTVPNNSYGNMSGTSMASPTAAGVAAEVLAHFPQLTPYQLKELLMSSVVPVAVFSGKMVTGGRIDLFKALEKGSSL